MRRSVSAQRRWLSVLQPVFSAVQHDDAAAKFDSVYSDRSGREGRADQQCNPVEVREPTHSRVCGASECDADAAGRGGDAADQIELAAAHDHEEFDDVGVCVGGRSDQFVFG